YLGSDTDGDDPLLIVEAKRPSAELPILLHDASAMPVQDAEILRRGLRGAELSGDWPKWLETMRDYIERVTARAGRPPRRVVLTSGEWLVAFREPVTAFVNISESINIEDILIISSPADLEYRAKDVFDWLEHQNVLNQTPALTLGEVPFEISGDDVESITHGL